MPPLLMPGPLLGPLGHARGGARVPQSRYSLAFAAAGHQYVAGAGCRLNGLAALTVAAWAKKADASGGYAVSFPLDSGGSNGVDLSLGNVWTADLVTAGGAAAPALGAHNDGAWHHVAVTYDGASATPYVDGVAGTALPLTGAVRHQADGEFDFGRFGTFGAYWSGSLDDVLVVPSALSGAQVAALAAGTLDPATLSFAGGGGLWRFEEGTGTATADSSGNGNTGTLTAGPTWSTDTPSALQ